jgi:hypothetical protein
LAAGGDFAPFPPFPSARRLGVRKSTASAGASEADEKFIEIPPAAGRR